MLTRMMRSSVAMRAAEKRPAYSVSKADEHTTGMRVEWAEMGWLRKMDWLGIVTVIAAEEVMAVSDAAGVRARQVRYARHDPKDHVGGTVNLVPIGMGGDEAEQTLKAKHCTLGGVGLLGGKRASGSEDVGVD